MTLVCATVTAAVTMTNRRFDHVLLHARHSVVCSITDRSSAALDGLTNHVRYRCTPRIDQSHGHIGHTSLHSYMRQRCAARTRSQAWRSQNVSVTGAVDVGGNDARPSCSDLAG